MKLRMFWRDAQTSLLFSSLLPAVWSAGLYLDASKQSLTFIGNMQIKYYFLFKRGIKITMIKSSKNLCSEIIIPLLLSKNHWRKE